MALSLAEVAQLARLARLELSSEEIARFRGHLDAVLERIAELGEINGISAEMVANGAADAGPWRADEPGPDALRLPVDSFATDMASGFFTVPRVIPAEGSSP